MLHFAALSLTVACVASLTFAERRLLTAAVTGSAALAACLIASGIGTGLVVWCALLMAVSSVLVLALAPRPRQARGVTLVSTLLGVTVLAWFVVAR